MLRCVFHKNREKVLDTRLGEVNLSPRKHIHHTHHKVQNPMKYDIFVINCNTKPL